jgi:SAM-dependent methyltransferase
MRYDEIEMYRRNKNIAFDGIEQWWMHRLCRKSLRLAARWLGRPAVPVLSERLVEYPLLFQYLDLEPAGSHLLDFGCVEDLLPLHLCGLGYRVTGLDFRPYPFRHRRFEFIQADILDWAPPSNAFDAAIAMSTVEHVGLGAYGDPRTADGDKVAVEKLLDATRPGGRLFLTVPAGRSTTTATMRVYDSDRLNALVPGAEVIRFFAKPGRHGEWSEIEPEAIDGLVYDTYDAISAAQGVAFAVVRKRA